MGLIHLTLNTPVDEVVSCLLEYGYCIIDNAVAPEVMDAIYAEVQPFIDAAPPGEAVTGAKTRRVGALPARSPASHQLIMHPTVLGAARKVIERNSSTTQLNLTQIIAIKPGQGAQFLHRDELAWDCYDHFPVDVDIEVSTIWAMVDFVDENGATRVIPNSHRHEGFAADFTLDDSLPAEMAKGSVLVYLGKTVHGGGWNRSDGDRRAVNIDYCAGWVRQEENQYLSVSLEAARALPEDLRELMGYSLGGHSLGYVREFEHPRVALFPDEPARVVRSTDIIREASRFSANAASALKQLEGQEA